VRKSVKSVVGVSSGLRLHKRASRRRSDKRQILRCAAFNYTWWRGFTAVSNKNNIILRPPKGDVPAY
jgi:hypothetical protein